MASAMWLQGLDVAGILMYGEKMKAPVRTQATNCLWNHYKCKDGRWIVLAMTQSDRYWPAFCEAMGKEDLIEDPRFSDIDRRHEHCEELISILDPIFLTKSAKQRQRELR